MDKPRILIFAGTADGRELFEILDKAGVRVEISVATEYGREVALEHAPKDSILTGRLSLEEMEELFHKKAYSFVIDATHPYAVEVTKNIKKASEETSTRYLRLLRKEETPVEGVDIKACANLDEAIEFLSSVKGNILSTVGSKELSKLTRIPNYKERVYARILPLLAAVKNSLDLGFKGSHLICMQGPFSYEMNRAMVLQYDCKFLLTKDSGREGGFREKCLAAKDTKATVVLLKRPEEEGYSFEEILNFLEKRLSISLTHRGNWQNDKE